MSGADLILLRHLLMHLVDWLERSGPEESAFEGTTKITVFLLSQHILPLHEHRIMDKDRAVNVNLSFVLQFLA